MSCSAHLMSARSEEKDSGVVGTRNGEQRPCMIPKLGPATRLSLLRNLSEISHTVHFTKPKGELSGIAVDEWTKIEVVEG